MGTTPRPKLAQTPHNVNPMTNAPPYQLAFPGMIHHNVTHTKPYLLVRGISDKSTSSYGVSKKRRVLTPELLLKRWDRIRECILGPLGFTLKQSIAIERILRLWAYYGLVYPKAAQVAQEPETTESMAAWRAGEGLGRPPGSYGCSRATFWRTIKILQARGLVETVNRFVFRKHAQISNLYKLDNLIIVLARYLSEHGQAFTQAWLKPYLLLPGLVFWKMSSSCNWGLENTT